MSSLPSITLLSSTVCASVIVASLAMVWPAKKLTVDVGGLGAGWPSAYASTHPFCVGLTTVTFTTTAVAS